MEEWNSLAFDPKLVGWKTGKAPFGQCGGELAPRPKLKPTRPTCYMDERCGCDTTPNTLWERKVLLMRRTFELLEIKEGRLYRLVMAGAGCDRSGEGYAIYVNGKLLIQKDSGYFRHPGIRGAIIPKDILPELKKGKFDIAVINFLRYTHVKKGNEWLGKTVPPNGQVTLYFEEAKLPKALILAAENANEEGSTK